MSGSWESPDSDSSQEPRYTFPLRFFQDLPLFYGLKLKDPAVRQTQLYLLLGYYLLFFSVSSELLI